MRGRRARGLYLVPSDVPILQPIARSPSQPWFHVQHARILLAVCAGQRIQTIAVQMQCDPAIVWRICRRYKQQGIAAILQDDERTGRPQRICVPAHLLRAPTKADRPAARTLAVPGREVDSCLHTHRTAAETPHEQKSLETQIAATGRQMDKLVYELHGLTPDEIKIVEEGTA